MFVYVACMLKIPISPVFKGVSCEIRVCCASFVNSKIGLLDFALRYLCFQAPIPTLLERKTICSRKGDIQQNHSIFIVVIKNIYIFAAE